MRFICHLEIKGFVVRGGKQVTAKKELDRTIFIQTVKVKNDGNDEKQCYGACV